MGREIIAVITLFLITGCADFDLHIRKETFPVKVSKILIGNFECRNMNYDPYVAEEYRDALKFEFFKKGIDALLLPEHEGSLQNDPDKTSALAAKYSGDILIRGVISERESGFLTDREVRSYVSFFVYSCDGREIGEGYFYTENPAANESIKRSAAEKFTNEFLEYTKSR